MRELLTPGAELSWNLTVRINHRPQCQSYCLIRWTRTGNMPPIVCHVTLHGGDVNSCEGGFECNLIQFVLLESKVSRLRLYKMSVLKYNVENAYHIHINAHRKTTANSENYNRTKSILDSLYNWIQRWNISCLGVKFLYAYTVSSAVMVGIHYFMKTVKFPIDITFSDKNTKHLSIETVVVCWSKTHPGLAVDPLC